MLSVIAELHFEGVRVVSVADGLDSDDEEATLGIQIRGIFNELQLRDLKKKTLRGQMGQKARGFSVGERTFGYKSVPVGTIQMDKKGRPRPEG
jgi:DNA invertase Pin-like site-specific DNA recombinase